MVGLYHTSASKINSAVNDKLIGYASMMVWKVRLWGKTRYTHASRVPQTPNIVSSAGASEMPNPRR